MRTHCRDCGMLLTEENRVVNTRTLDKIYYRSECKLCHREKKALYLATYPRASVAKDGYAPDPWRHAVCGRCPLPDCVRPEGVFMICNASRNVAKMIAVCPISQAERRGWTPAEAAERGPELGLLPKGEWGEW